MITLSRAFQPLCVLLAVATLALFAPQLQADDAAFTSSDADEVGAFNFNGASAEFLQTDDGLNLTYSVPSGGGAGIWTKAYPEKLNRKKVSEIQLNLSLTNEVQLDEINLAIEVKGTSSIQTIPVAAATPEFTLTEPLNWDLIGELKEVVLVVTPKTDETASGQLGATFGFLKSSGSLTHHANPLLRLAQALGYALLFAVVFGLLGKIFSSKTPQTTIGLTRDLTFGLAAVLITAASFYLYRQPLPSVLWISGTGALIGAILSLGLRGKVTSAGETFLNALVSGVLAASAHAIPMLASPAHLIDVIKQPAFAAAVYFALYHGINAWSLANRSKHLSFTGGLTILAVPFLFTLLLILTSPAGAGLWRTALIVFVFNEITAAVIAMATRRTRVKGFRLHLILLVSAIAVACGPLIAELGSGIAIAALSGWIQFPITILTTIFSQAGLWMEAYLITGLVMDAIHGNAPNLKSAKHHAFGGAKKGMVYSGVFMAIMHGLHYLLGSSAGQWLFENLPWVMAAVFGALVFPLFKTIIESFDGSVAFFQRVKGSYRHPWHYLRGAVIGAGAAWAISSGLFDADTGQRCLIGLAIGVFASSGVSLIRDIASPRGRVRSWRAYFIDSLMGGFIGTALGFYFDAAQVQVVIAKFYQYVAIGEAPKVHGITVFVSQWGQLNLGEYSGGVSLFFKEALAGVLTWSIAAWMFAINRTFLAAALDRTTSPIKFLFSRDGFVQLVQHMIEVMRWGLWMSPIILSFLRMSGEPTWYNQDGAIRTVVAIFQDLTLSHEEFVQWSLNTFIALLAYDLIRILIWVDHMGLRVATLVNFSFLGMDKLDGIAAKFIGKDATARYIPEGVKRFTTWAPLLIPFYIPMGGQWDYAWNTAAELRANAGPSLTDWLAALSPSGLAGVAIAAFVVFTAIFALVRFLRNRKADTNTGSSSISNRDYEVIIKDSGECYSRLSRLGHDLTRRAYDFRDPAGRALFVVDETSGTSWPVFGNYPEELSPRPVIEVTNDQITAATTAHDTRTVLTITLPDDEDLAELWTVEIEDLSGQSRSFTLVPYVEWVINDPGGDRGHTQYNRLFPEISYEPGSNALLALHRYTKRHGILASEAPVSGFLTSRIDFIGRAQSLWSPRVLEAGNFLNPQETDACPSFDPISTLQVKATEGGTRFLIGCTVKRKEALKLIKKHLKVDAAKVTFDEAQAKRRPLIGHGEILPGTPQPYQEYSKDGNTLRVLTPFTPRPWDHSMSNSLGHVLCVTNRGLHTTANGNSQQNRVTPDWADTVTREAPGEALYLYDIDAEKWVSPTWDPLRDPESTYTTDFSVDGTATFHMTQQGLATDLTLFVPREDPVGLYKLTIRNEGDTTKRFRFSPYFHLTLADMPENSGPLKIDTDGSTGALYFQNPRNTFRPGVAFAALTETPELIESHRGRFYGTDHTVAHPPFVANGTPVETEADAAPIAAFLKTLEVPGGGEVTIGVMLGQTDTRKQADAVVAKYQSLETVDAELQKNRDWWLQLMSTNSVTTDDTDFNHLQNWLKYQALAERIWARRGFYQASGAFGFRDQLQDSVNMIWVDPTLAHSQLQLHAAQQFIEGDTVHWFFRQQDGRTGFACRSHAYDNLLWLGWGVAEYVRMTGDQSLLDISVPYLDAEQPLLPLPEGKHGMGFYPQRSSVSESIYNHCLRAFDLVFNERLGPNGLPLIGAGDWNDGLDEIGSEGRGESTWLGFFLCYTLRDFLPIIEKREGSAKRAHYETKRDALVEALEGTWREDRYLRAIHDDGTEIGIAGSGVWEIDALTAAWSVMSGINPERSRICFDTAVRELERDKVVLLGTPALREDTKPYLGRSSRYPEGVRENGMYCHGDQWLVKASRILTEQCLAEGDKEAAASYRTIGYRVWSKISPIFHTTPEEIETYGGQPNKQCADILTTFDPGRMIWNGYTGASGWVLREVFEGIVGCNLIDNAVVMPTDLDQPRGDLSIKEVTRDLSNSPF